MLLDTKLNYTIPVQPKRTRFTYDLIPANHFTFQELTDIYNDTRADYVVPMPMNEAKLREYVNNYDIDLTRSVVAKSAAGALGLAMLGVRGETTWITRLGITPKGRRKGVGRRLMIALIDYSRRLKAEKIILEVIKANKPARALFESLNFQTLRELLVIRRPPTPVNAPSVDQPGINLLGHEETVALLQQRIDTPSWVTANESMVNAGNLSTLVADLPNIGRGWLAYQNSTFQLSRLVIDTEAEASLEAATTLLQNLHQRFPLKDTVVENLAADDRHWPVFEALGYLTSFIRVEMELDLTVESNGSSKPERLLTQNTLPF